MAHQTQVNQVPAGFDVRTSDDQVKDLVCGMVMPRKESRCVVFRGDEEFHFCSRACRDEFLKPTAMKGVTSSSKKAA